MKALAIRDWDRHFENAESRKIKGTTYVCVPNKQDGKGFARVASHKQSCRVFTGWMLILQVASKMPQRGVLVDEDGALEVDDLAAMTRFDEATFTTAIEVLTSPKVGWLEWVEIPAKLVTSGRKPDEIPVRQDSVPSRPDASGRTEGNRTEQKGTEQNISPPPKAHPDKSGDSSSIDLIGLEEIDKNPPSQSHVEFNSETSSTQVGVNFEPQEEPTPRSGLSPEAAEAEVDAESQPINEFEHFRAKILELFPTRKRFSHPQERNFHAVMPHLRDLSEQEWTDLKEWYGLKERDGEELYRFALDNFLANFPEPASRATEFFQKNPKRRPSYKRPINALEAVQETEKPETREETEEALRQALTAAKSLGRERSIKLAEKELAEFLSN